MNNLELGHVYYKVGEYKKVETDVTRRLYKEKATGPDGFSSKMLDEPRAMVPILKEAGDWYNKGTPILREYDDVRLVTVSKDQKPITTEGKVRPLSIMCVPRKVPEMTMLRIYEEMLGKIIPDSQQGGRRKGTCFVLIARLVQAIRKGMAIGFIDYEKAYEYYRRRTMAKQYRMIGNVMDELIRIQKKLWEEGDEGP